MRRVVVSRSGSVVAWSCGRSADSYKYVQNMYVVCMNPVIVEVYRASELIAPFISLVE